MTTEPGARADDLEADTSEPISLEGLLPPVPSRSGVRRIAFDEGTIAIVAALFDAAAQPAPFTLPGGPVADIVLTPAEPLLPVRLRLWPSLHRVDASTAQSTVVATGIIAVDLVAGVEVQFRRMNGGLLIISTGGNIIVRC